MTDIYGDIKCLAEALNEEGFLGNPEAFCTCLDDSEQCRMIVENLYRRIQHELYPHLDTDEAICRAVENSGVPEEPGQMAINLLFAYHDCYEGDV